jgi:hypothetical protein
MVSVRTEPVIDIHGRLVPVADIVIELVEWYILHCTGFDLFLAHSESCHISQADVEAVTMEVTCCCQDSRRCRFSSNKR